MIENTDEHEGGTTVTTAGPSGSGPEGSAPTVDWPATFIEGLSGALTP